MFYTFEDLKCRFCQQKINKGSALKPVKTTQSQEIFKKYTAIGNNSFLGWTLYEKSGINS
jgi:hypothetical protein